MNYLEYAKCEATNKAETTLHCNAAITRLTINAAKTDNISKRTYQ